MQKLPPKKDVCLALLEQASVFVHLDPRGDDVRVPKWFKKQPQLVLQVGLNMPVPIPDLAVEDDAVSCTLSFSRSPFFCFVPWSSVYALVGEDGRGMVWPEDVPKEVAVQQQPAPQPKKRGGLRVVGEGEGDGDDAPQEPEQKPQQKQERKLAAVADPVDEAAEEPSDERETRDDEPGDRDESSTDEAAGDGDAAASGDASPDAEPEGTTDDEAGGGDQPAVDGDDDGKRKLPPYLRVVK